jgi:hypothetical protein
MLGDYAGLTLLVDPLSHILDFINTIGTGLTLIGFPHSSDALTFIHFDRSRALIRRQLSVPLGLKKGVRTRSIAVVLDYFNGAEA